MLNNTFLSYFYFIILAWQCVLVLETTLIKKIYIQKLIYFAILI